MKCVEVQRVLPEMLEGGQNRECLAHLQSCPDCAELVSDLKVISTAAAQLAESEEPAPRVWVRIAAELRSEGLIREPESQPAGPVLVPGERRRWNARWLVPVAAALVVAGAYVANLKPAMQIADRPPAVAPAPANTSAQKESPAPVVNNAPTTADRRQADSQSARRSQRGTKLLRSHGDRQH